MINDQFVIVHRSLFTILCSLTSVHCSPLTAKELLLVICHL